MNEKIQALWVWIKTEANMNKFRKDLPEEMTVNFRPKDEHEHGEKSAREPARSHSMSWEYKEVLRRLQLKMRLEM